MFHLTIHGQAVDVLLSKAKHKDLASFGLDDDKLLVLNDVRAWLKIMHTGQELLAAHKTPTLPLLLPVYEEMVNMLRDAILVHSGIQHAVSASVDKLLEYIRKCRKSRLYTFAMGTYSKQVQIVHICSYCQKVINPISKFEWLKKHWETEDYESARSAVKQTVMVFLPYYILY